MIWGLAYTEYFNAWGNTVNGSLEATIEDYSIRTNPSNLMASLGGPEGDGGGASDWVQTKTDQLWYLGYGTSFISICSGKDVPFVTKLSGRIGKTAGLLNLTGTYYIAKSDGYISWGDKLRIGVASAEYFGTNYFMNPWVTVPSLAISVIDAAGGFDNWYDAWDQSEKMYLESGVTILPINMPHNGMPIIIHK